MKTRVSLKYFVTRCCSNIKYKEDDNTQSNFHQQDQMETVIKTTPDICNQNKVTFNPYIEENNAKKVNQKISKEKFTKN